VDRRTTRLVAAWLATHRSDNTRSAYERDLAHFSRWCDSTGRDPLRAGPDDVDGYRDACLAAGASPATVTRRLSGVASFFRYATGVGVLTANPADAVARPEGEAATPASLDDGELGALVDAADDLGPKTAALVALLALEGLKLGEVLAIDVPRLRLDDRSVSVDVRRHGATQTIAVTPRTAAAVTAHVAGRRRGPLFLGESPVAHRPARLTRFGADFLVKRAGAAAGIGKPVSAGILRRSYVEAARRAGTPLAEIAQHIGHREVRETARLLEEPK
jgi:site-specific recombinase XerD